MDYEEKSEFVEEKKPKFSTIGKKAGRRRLTLKLRKVSKKRLRRTVGRKRRL